MPPAPWSDYQPIVEHTFTLTQEASRADFIEVCYASKVSDEVVDGFDSLDGRLTFRSIEQAKEALQAAGALAT
ncbi:MAG: hypothetical protein EXR65_03565 [Dehalococcoidia bacterium]|nr:hypothetical protein [Dehalococcoidia bacterium]